LEVLLREVLLLLEVCNRVLLLKRLHDRPLELLSSVL
jgi:hypothetical protein